MRVITRRFNAAYSKNGSHETLKLLLKDVAKSVDL